MKCLQSLSYSCRNWQFDWSYNNRSNRWGSSGLGSLIAWPWDWSVMEQVNTINLNQLSAYFDLYVRSHLKLWPNLRRWHTCMWVQTPVSSCDQSTFSDLSTDHARQRMNFRKRLFPSILSLFIPSACSYVKNGILYLKPTFTADYIGEAAVEGGYDLNLWGGSPADMCTGNQVALRSQEWQNGIDSTPNLSYCLFFRA